VSKCYVTTAVPYVNAPPHVGFALELVQADVISRYHRLVGHRTRFQTGTDENAFKNVVAARERGLSTEEFVRANSDLFRQLCAALDALPDDFLRTTEPRHVAAVHHLWRGLKPDDVYRARYRGAYCIGCEDFLRGRDLVDGCCPEHGAPPVPVDEENYFFRLSAYQHDIQQLVATDRIRVIPRNRKEEVLAFIRGGLHDISISRDAARAGGWGIAVPCDPSQIIYVWIDALVNYISGLGFGAKEDWTSYWEEDTLKVHVIGKNVWKFHAVYWPALLLSAGLPLPNHIVVHGFLTEQGQKISKSLGSVVDPFACVQEFGVDAVRHYLLRGASPFADSDFSTERLRLVYNADLANNLGNLVSRLTTLCETAEHGGVGQEPTPEAPPGYHQSFEAYDLDKALNALWAGLDRINREIDRLQPWKAIKGGSPGRIAPHLTAWLGELHRIAYWLAPFLPNAAQTVLSALGRRPLRSSGVLFPRLP
jgi:methionyl-tRNA synthetase